MKTELDEKKFLAEYRAFLSGYLHHNHDGLVTDGLLDTMAQAAASAAAIQLLSELSLHEWTHIWRSAEAELRPQ